MRLANPAGSRSQNGVVVYGPVPLCGPKVRSPGTTKELVSGCLTEALDTWVAVVSKGVVEYSLFHQLERHRGEHFSATRRSAVDFRALVPKVRGW